MPPQKPGPWDVVSTAPVSGQASSPPGDWDVVSTSMDPPAVNPSIPVPAALQGPPAPQFGSSLSDVFNTAAQHAKNMVAGPFHAFADAPRNPEEQQWKGTNPQSGMAANALGQFGLGAARMFVEPTIMNARNAAAQYQAGNTEGAFQSAMDAVPVVGPWAKQIETDTQNKGAVAGLAGLATDVLAPTLAAKGAGMALKPLARTAAVSDVKNMIRPNATDSAFGKTPAEGLLNQPGGVMSMTKPGLLAKTKANIADTGQQIGDAVAQAPQTPVDVSGAVNNPFQVALQRAAQGNEKGLVSGLKDAQQGYTHDLFYDPASEEIAGQSSPKNMSMTPSDIFNLKKKVGDGIRWTNQAFDSDLNATRGQVYGGLKDQLNQAVPSLKPLNEQYGNMRAGASALERRIPIEERNNPISLGDMGMAGAGGAMGGGPGAAALFAAKKVLTSQPVRSTVDTGLWKYGNAPSKLSPSAARLLFSAPRGSKSD